MGLAKQVTEIELYDLARDFLGAFPSSAEPLSGGRIQEVAKNYRSATRIAALAVGDRGKVGADSSGFRTVEFFENRGLVETSLPTLK